MQCGAVDVVNHVSEPILVELSILRHEIRGDPRPLQTSDRVARLLHDRGLVEGDRFVTVNALWNIDWAQRAGYVVRAYTPEYTVGFTQTFRELRDPCQRAIWEQQLAAAHIDAAVMFVPNGFVAPSGFDALDDTGYYVMRIVRRPLRDGCRVA